jgi:hypothetical protein
MSNPLKIHLDIDPPSFQDDVATGLMVPGISSASEVISSAVELAYQQCLDSLAASRVILRYTPLGRARWLGNDTVSLRAILEEDWLNLWPLDITIVRPKGSGRVEFVPPKHLVWGKDPKRETLNVYYGCASTHGITPPQVSYQALKTVDKHRIRLWPVAVPTEFMKPVRRRFADPCNCLRECMQGNLAQAWDWVVRFICRICGRAYVCQCFQPAMKQFLRKAEKSSHRYGENGWPNRFIRAYKAAQFREGLCHICRGVPSDLTYCSGMYRNEFMVRYGCYVQRVAIENEISEE